MADASNVRRDTIVVPEARPSIATARSFVHGPARFERLAEVQSTSRGLIVVDDDGVAVFTRNGENMTACSGTTSPMIDPVLVWGESMVDAP